MGQKKSRRDFIKFTVATASGLAALPILSIGQGGRTAANVLKPGTLLSATYLKDSKIVRRFPNITNDHLAHLLEAAMGNSPKASQKFKEAYKASLGRESWIAKTPPDELMELADLGYAQLTGGGLQPSPGGIIAVACCCCCCCPCCCCGSGGNGGTGQGSPTLPKK